MTVYITKIGVRLIVISLVVGVFALLFPVDVITSIEDSVLYSGAYFFPKLFSFEVALFLEQTIGFLLTVAFVYHVIKP